VSREIFMGATMPGVGGGEGEIRGGLPRTGGEGGPSYLFGMADRDFLVGVCLACSAHRHLCDFGG